MMGNIEERVAQHYAHGTLDRAISDALAASGVNADRLAPADLAQVDEFHIGGRQATTEFAEQLDIEPGMRLLDIGCGLGGASRYFALDPAHRIRATRSLRARISSSPGIRRGAGRNSRRRCANMRCWCGTSTSRARRPICVSPSGRRTTCDG